jgi:uncharacterized protein (TIGR03435 family)
MSIRLCSIVALAALHFAQAQPAFEVASVRPSGPRPPNGGPLPISGERRGGPGTSDPETITYSRVPLQTILMNAFGLPVDQLSGPTWIVSERYDIAARVPVGATKAQASLMLQNLLVERFHLTFHRQPKEFQAYELVVAPGGSKLKETVVTQNSDPPASFRVTADKDGFPMLPPGVHQASLMSAGHTRARFRDFSLLDFAPWLGVRLGTFTPGPLEGSAITAPVRIADKSGLTGKYDFTLEYAGAMIAAEALPPDLRDRLDENGPSIFTALEKQLGLKLEKFKAQLDVLVIDNIDKVSAEN